jgi:hypothetical protein
LFETYLKSGQTWLIGIELLLISYCLIVAFICLTKVRLKPFHQILLVVCFLLSSIIIISSFLHPENLAMFCQDCAAGKVGYLAIFLTGYASFYLVSNLLFVIYFIPIPLSRRESFKQRIANIKLHARDLEKKYIDIDIGLNRTILILAITPLLIVNGAFSLVGEEVAISLILVFGELLTSSNEAETDCKN